MNIGSANDVGGAHSKPHALVAGDVDEQAPRGEPIELAVVRHEHERVVGVLQDPVDDDVIDASQSVGALPLDSVALRPHFLITVRYKWLLGPFGLGHPYVAEDHREGEPLEENWSSAQARSTSFGSWTTPTSISRAPGASTSASARSSS